MAKRQFSRVVLPLAAFGAFLVATAAWADITTDDTVSSPLTVSGDGTTTLSLNQQVGISASVPGSSSGGVTASPNDSGVAAPQYAYLGYTITNAPVGGTTPVYTHGMLIGGDINGTGVINAQDLSLLQAHWGQDQSATVNVSFWEAFGEPAGTTTIGAQDLSILQANFGEYYVTPEPASWIIWAGCILAAVFYVRRRHRLVNA
jgi:hypothetical protein